MLWSRLAYEAIYDNCLFSAVRRGCSFSAVSHSALGGCLARPAYCAPLHVFDGYCNIASRWGNGDSAACRRGAPIVCEGELSTPRANGPPDTANASSVAALRMHPSHSSLAFGRLRRSTGHFSPRLTSFHAQHSCIVQSLQFADL